MHTHRDLNKYITEGATVVSRDGEKLGKIIACGADDFIVEKGIFFPKDYCVQCSDVLTADKDEIVLKKTKEELCEIDQDELASERSGFVGPESAGATSASQRDVRAGAREIPIERRTTRRPAEPPPELAGKTPPPKSRPRT